MEGDLHFSGWEASLEEKETRDDGYLCALNELSLMGQIPQGCLLQPHARP